MTNYFRILYVESQNIYAAHINFVDIQTTGFSDLAPLVREQTVKSVLTIIVKLTDRTINGELLKYLAKTSNDTEPGIRTNTTICLGKIAKHLGPNVRLFSSMFRRLLQDAYCCSRLASRFWLLLLPVR